MGLFSSSVSDEVWVGPASSIYKAAAPIIGDLGESWVVEVGGLHWNCLPVTVSALNSLPGLQRQASALSEPSSQAAKAAHKGMKDAIQKGIKAAEPGAGLLDSFRSGVAYRALYETGVARRAAAGRVSMTQSRIAFEIKDARKGLAQAEQYFVV